MTYAELDRRSDWLAHHLHALGVRRETFVALCLERSFDLLTAVWAVLKAGGAYVPLDIGLPAQRRDFMLADAGAPVLLTQASLGGQLSTEATVVVLDELWPELEQRYGHLPPPENINRPDDLAYMIYTSGSTGRPKGVMIQHDHVIHQLEGQYAIAPEPMEATLLTASISFDVSVLTIFWTHLLGKPLVLPRQGEEKDMPALARLIAATGVTHVLTLPSLHTLLLDQARPEQLRSLRLVNVSGEVCPTSLAQKHEQRIPWAQLYNLYGPTEATVNCTWFRLPKGFDAPKVPIGKPIPNYRIFILSENMKPVRDDEVGEIYIGGDKPVVARGYWNRPELTAERFVANPFDAGGERLYRTGDLARWMPDGNIEFLGRADNQIKFRGYRIELGEIEVALGNHPAVREVVVMLRGEEPERQRLVAWLTFHEGQSATVSALRAWLEERLPEYMVPAVFVILDRMPLTTNGKIDRRALPDPPGERPPLAQPWVPPQGPLETWIAERWSKLLQVHPVGRHDRFFELGGHSLLAARFIAELQKALGASVFITTIFDHPDVASYAAMLQREYPDEVEALFAERRNKQKGKSRPRPDGDRLTAGQVAAFAKYLPHYPAPALRPERKGRKAVFILAPPRSGTTLLRAMLAGHPQLFAANELQLMHFDTLAQRSRTYTGKFALWQEGLIRAVMALKQCDADEARAFLLEREQAGATTLDIWHWLEETSGRIVADKSPSYALDPNALQRMADWFEDARFVHLVRHPWSAARSFARYHMHQVVFMPEHPYAPHHLGELIWLYSHRHIIEFLQNIPADRQIRIRYEDLVRRPEPAMRALCDALDLPFDARLLDPYAALEQKMVDGIYEASRSMGDIHFAQRRAIDPAQADKWQGVWDDNFLSEETWKLATRFGYPDAPEPAAPAAKVTLPADTTSKADTGAIAIIGMSVRVAGAEDVDAFWQNLISRRDVSEPVTADDLRADGLDPALLRQPDYVARRYALKDGDCFDAAFFGIRPREAALMDPQHRILLEEAWHVLERAGYDPRRYAGRIGIAGGVARNSYLTHNLAGHDELRGQAGEYHFMLGNESSFAISRIAYLLGLKGPALDVQTACSTGGVAIHLAVEALRRGEADMMLVGGGRIQPPFRAGYHYREGQPLARDGRIRAFDADASGMVQGHGVAFVLLKPLEAALRDGDHIHAVIRGSAVNNDGGDKTAFTAPSATGQAEVIEAAWRRAGIEPERIGLVEAHGTGTLLGDPIELTGLAQAFRKFTDKARFCALHSVKTHVGHLDAGAGIIGLITAALALERAQLPPVQHFRRPNPHIAWDRAPFFVSDRLRPWPRTEGRPRLAAVSSFGLGGTNAHIVLEEAPPLPRTEASPRTFEWLCLSAKTEQALHQQADQLADWLERQDDDPALADVAFTLAHRPQLPERLALIAATREEAVELLRTRAGRQVVRGTDNGPRKVAFLFPGGGAQYAGMAAGLYATLPVFRRWADRLMRLVRQRHGLDPGWLFAEADEARRRQIEQPSWALASLFVVELAMARTLEHLGLRPDLLIGHSAGEYVAAHLAGVFSLEDALDLAVLRGKLFETLPADGAMLSVSLGEAELQALLDESCCISVVNKPDNCVVSGPAPAIEALQKRLEEQGIECRRIHIRVAAHSPQVEPILSDFAKALEKIEWRHPTLPLVSNLTGRLAEPEQIASPQYWLDHLRHTVRFADGLDTLLQSDAGCLVEVGPGQTLLTFARQHPAWSADKLAVATIRHPREQTDDTAFFLRSLARLWTEGPPVRPEALYEERRRRVPLPGYPFARVRHWIEPAQSAQGAGVASGQSNELRLSANEARGATPAPAPPAARTVSAPVSASVPREKILEKEIKKLLFELSGMAEDQLDPTATFLELGFDSLFLSQVVLALNRHFGTEIAFRQLFEQTPDIASLARWLDEVLPPEAFQPEPMAATAGGQDLPKGENTTIESASEPEARVRALAEGGQTELADIVRRQLELMQRQLELLGGAASDRTSASAAPPPAEKAERPARAHSAPRGVTAKLKPADGSGGGALTLSPAQERWLRDFAERYNRKTARSKAQAARHKRVYADPRSVTGFHRLWKEVTYQLAAERSAGSRFTDLDGNEYIDYVMSYGVALFGHSPGFVREAVQRQLERGTALDLLSPLATEVGELLTRLSGKARMTLANTGTEALVAAVRAARAATGRDRIAVFDTDYHGLTDEFLLRAFRFGEVERVAPLAPGIPRFLAGHVLVLDYNRPEEALARIEAEADTLAAVVVEPIQAQNPHWQHFELMPRLRALTERLGLPLVFDEIINGFRLHQRGAQAWYGIEADIVAYGKAISGGLPLAAIAGAERYLQVFDGGRWQFGDDSAPEAAMTYFAGTFIKNPVSLAAAHAALSEIERRGPELQEGLNRTGYRFARKLADLFRRTGAPLFVTSTSSIFNIKFADNNPLNQLFFPLLALNGVHMRARPCFLSTAHSEADLEQTLQAVEATIEELLAHGIMQPWTGEDLNAVVAPPWWPDEGPEGRPSPPQEHKQPESVRLSANEAPLTDGQQEIFLQHQLSPEAGKAYTIGTQIRLRGPLDAEALHRALEQLIARHEALRMTIAPDGRHMRIAATRALELPVDDLSSRDEAAKRATFDRLLQLEAETPFDLEAGPLTRFRLVRLAPEEHVLLLTAHHIACDGWSLGILTRELGTLYAALTGKRTMPLAPPPGISRYAREEEQWRQTEAFKRTLEWWQARFADGGPAFELPTDFPRPKVRSWRGGMERLRLRAPFAERLKKAAGKEGSTLYVWMLAAFEAWLHRLSGAEELVVGIPVAGHNLPGFRQLVGHAINLLPLRTRIEGQAPFRKWLHALRSHLLDAFEHQRLSFGRLVQTLDLPRHPDRNTLVSIAFNMDSPLEGLDFGALEVDTLPLPRHYETFDIYINLKPVGEEIWFEWNYNADLWRPETIRMRLAEFEHLLRALLDKPECPLSQLDVVPPVEKQLLHVWQHGPGGNFRWRHTLHEWMEAAAGKWPDKVAVRDGRHTLTCRQLDTLANRIAHALIEAGVQPGQRVAVMLERTPRMLAALYGVLKAGAAYVPIEPFNPEARVRHIAADAACACILTEDAHRAHAAHAGIPLLDLDAAELERLPAQAPEVAVTPEMDAYLIYTSGSTGLPKGVAISHQAAAHTLHAINRQWQAGPDDVCLSVSSMSFDMSIPDYFLIPACGATLVLADDATRQDGLALAALMDEVRPTLMQATPATWRLLLLSGWEGQPTLRAVAGGEALPGALAADLLPRVGALWNGYGPTEATIYATWHRVREADLDAPFSETIPIGRPLPDVVVSVRDAAGHVLPPGIPGELWIGGPGVADGYLGQPEMTARHFIEGTNGQSGQRWYRTGDRVRHLPTGELEFLGRLDGQVKVRGYRIETGEVEAALHDLPEVREAVVGLWPEAQALVAWYVPADEGVTGERLRAALSRRLPAWMVPTHFVRMDALPRNSSLKIDRKALPLPARMQAAPEAAPAALSPLENWLADLWASLLGRRPAPEDDFFALGGHSLLAADLMAQIWKEKGVRLPLAALLQHSTLRALARQIEARLHSRQQGRFSSLVPIRTEGDKPALFLVHGGGLHVLFYEALTRHLPPDRPIYALQARGLDGESEPLDTIEAMAAHYIHEIRQVQPEGPWHLAGYSLGGLIAWEMARQLTEAGQQVGEVALFDAVASQHTGKGRWWKRLKKTGYTLQMLATAPARTLAYKSHVLQTQIKSLFGKWRLAWLDPRTNQIREGYLPFGKKVYEKCLEAYSKYRLRPAPVRVTVFRAKEQMFYLEDPEYLGWKDVALAGVEVVEVGGNHLTLFEEPHVTELARALQQRLESRDRHGTKAPS